MKASLTRQITVFVGLVVKDGKILLVRRNEPEVTGAHMKWEFPGGKADFGETSEEAIVRELREETGVIATVKRLLPHVQTVYWDYPWGTQHTIIFGFECEYVSSKKRKKDHHVESIAWVPLEKYYEYQTLPGGKEFFETLKST
ncbi:MAG: NUDIX domain-containing protein [Candidatus Levybacteria bacterium]|nr:NUDIX domain-containing protein [Candidatus Levybacteria bacterium]